MKLWLLKRNDASWDESHGYVVRAVDEEAARRLASDECTDYDDGIREFLDSLFSTCTEVTQDGPPEVILRV